MPAMGRVDGLDSQVARQFDRIVHAALARVAGGHHHAEHVFGAHGIGGDGGRQRRIDAAGKPQQHLPETASCARNPGRPAPARSRFRLRARNRPRRWRRPAGAAARSTTTRSSSKPLARANRRPCASKAPLRPSKMRSSLPPTWFTIDQRQAIFPSQVAEHLSRAEAVCPPVKGEAERLTMACAPALCQHLDGVLVIAPALQKSRSFQTSSQMLMPRRQPPNSRICGPLRRLEVAVLVEDVVSGQQRFVKRRARRRRPSAARRC